MNHINNVFNKITAKYDVFLTKTVQDNPSVDLRNNNQVACFTQKQVRVSWLAQKLDKMQQIQ